MNNTHKVQSATLDVWETRMREHVTELSRELKLSLSVYQNHLSRRHISEDTLCGAS
jgi:hypothetical protein